MSRKGSRQRPKRGKPRRRVFIYPTKQGFKAFRKAYAADITDGMALARHYAGFVLGVEHERNGGKKWYSVVNAPLRSKRGTP